MRFRRLLLGLAIALPMALAGCKVNTINSFNASPAQIRVANVIPDAPPLAITVDGTAAFHDVPFQTVTGYNQFTADQHNFGMELEGTDATLVTSEFNVAGQQNYTLVPFGSLAFPNMLMLPDVVQDTGNGTASVRFVLAAVGQSAVDIYVTAPDVVIDNINPTISFLGYGNAGGYTSFPEGTYRTRITIAGAKSVLYDSGVYTLASHSVSNAIIYSRGSNLLVNVMLLDTAGGTVIAENTLSTVKALNTSPGMANVDLLVDALPILPGLAYGIPSSYTYMPSAAKTFAFQASATPGAIIAQAAANVTPATDSTVLLFGFPGAQSVKVFPDKNLPPALNYTNVRFINASPDAPPLDVLINDVKTITGLASGTASIYLPLAVNTYTFKFIDPVTGIVSPTLSAQVLTSSVYTVYVLGPNSAMTAIFTIDR